jgi:hypothetical protein
MTALFIITLLLISCGVQMLYFWYQNKRALASLKSEKKRKGRFKVKRSLILQD